MFGTRRCLIAMLISTVLIGGLVQCSGEPSEHKTGELKQDGTPQLLLVSEFLMTKLALKYYQSCLSSYFMSKYELNINAIIWQRVTNPEDVLFPESLDEATAFLPIQLEVLYEPVLEFLELGFDSRWQFSISIKEYYDIDKYRWTITARSTNRSIFGSGVSMDLEYRKSEYDENEFLYVRNLSRERQRQIVINFPDGARDVIFK
jgi:hypothetical protein